MKAANVLHTIGNTPHIRINRLFGDQAQVWVKSERSNPGGSIKDRIALAMVEDAEKAGQLKAGGTIVEPTSGNTGVGLAMAANLKGYKLICTAADKIPKEKIALLEAFGAEVITCPTNVEADDPRSYYKVAERIREKLSSFDKNSSEGQLPEPITISMGVFTATSAETTAETCVECADKAMYEAKETGRNRVVVYS